MPEGFLRPEMRPIADVAVLVEFGQKIDDEVHQRVLDFDAALQRADVSGVTELIPSYTTVYVGYDPLVTDFETLCGELTQQLGALQGIRKEAAHWQIPVCYSEGFAPDLAEVSALTGLSPEAIIEQHSSGLYKVYMYGFAPGYAYLGGVPDAIQVPRKQAPVMDLPTGSILIAGPQCLITTIVMPSGWWNIGRTSVTPLQSGQEKQFLFDVGDRIEFIRMDESDFLKQTSNS